MTIDSQVAALAAALGGTLLTKQAIFWRRRAAAVDRRHPAHGARIAASHWTLLLGGSLFAAGAFCARMHMLGR